LDGEMRVDIIKRDTHRMEIVVYMGNTLMYKHTIELNPEVFSEDEAEAIMRMWSQVIQAQMYMMSQGKRLAKEFFRSLFGDDEDEEDFS